MCLRIIQPRDIVPHLQKDFQQSTAGGNKEVPTSDQVVQRVTVAAKLDVFTSLALLLLSRRLKLSTQLSVWPPLRHACCPADNGAALHLSLKE